MRIETLRAHSAHLAYLSLALSRVREGDREVMADRAYKVDNVVNGNADARAQSLLTRPGGPLAVHAAHIFAAACPNGYPAPAAATVEMTMHKMES